MVRTIAMGARVLLLVEIRLAWRHTQTLVATTSETLRRIHVEFASKIHIFLLTEYSTAIAKPGLHTTMLRAQV
jgi:hypothetical protein